MAAEKKKGTSKKKIPARTAGEHAELVKLIRDSAKETRTVVTKMVKDLDAKVIRLVSDLDAKVVRLVGDLDAKVVRLVGDLDTKVDEKTEFLARIMQEGFEEVNARLDKHDQYFDDILKRIEALESKVFGINHRLDGEALQKKDQQKSMLERLEKLEAAVFSRKK